MKKILLLLFVALQVNFVDAQTWTKLSSGTNNNLAAVSAPSQCIAYVVGDAGKILKTTDGGNTWVTQISGTTQNLRSVDFTSVSTGFVVADNGIALQTIDGGTTWTPMVIDPINNPTFRDIKFFNSQLGFASGGLNLGGGSGGVIYRTQDGGATWTQVLADNIDNYGFYSTFFTSASTGYASSGSGRIFETTDGGTTWNSIYFSANLSSGKIYFTNQMNGIRPGYNGEISLTQDAGSTWSQPSSGTTDYLDGIDFFDQNNGFIVGGDLNTNLATLLNTSDGGITWSKIPSPAGAARLNGVKFFDSSIGYSVGQNGTILRRTNLDNLVVVNSNSATICMGGFVNLTASGADSYTWTPSTGLNTTTGALVVATPLATTIYNIIGSKGCVMDTVLFTVMVLNPPTVNVNSATICDQACTLQTWNPQTSGISSALYDIDNIDDCISYAVGDNGVILKTTDNGKSWIPQPSGATTSSLRSVKFFNANTGYVVGTGNTILKTINGGSSWANIAPNLPGDNWMNLWVFDANTIIVGGGVVSTLAPAFIKSTDGGATWTSITTGALATIYGIYFTDNLNGYISTLFGNILKTIDGGLTWTTQLSNPQNNSSPQLGYIFFTDANTGYATGGRPPGNGIIYKTTDAGVTWTPIYTNASLYFSSIQFEDDLTGYASGGDIGANTGTMLKTTDGGISWNAINTNSTRLIKMDIQNINDQFVVGSSGTILKLCEGDSVRLKATGADSYVWSNGSTNQIIKVKPSQTTSYSVTGTVAACSSQSTAIATVTVPSFTVNSVTICSGQTATLTANGGTNFVWSTGETTQSIFVSPISGVKTYTVSSNFDCCIKSVISTVTVLNLPTITVNSVTVCVGATATLSVGGANTYTWSPTSGLSSTTAATVSVTPSNTTTYSVTGTDINGCVNSTTSLVNVNQLPVVTVNSATICAGSTTTLTAAGANSYTWTPAAGLSGAVGASVVASPTITSTYTISGIDVNGCFNSTISMVNVELLPTITVNAATTICAGGTATLTAGGANTYSWLPITGLSASTGTIVSATLLNTTTYSVTGTDINGCSNSTTTTVNVNQLPAIAVNSATVCAGATVTLTAIGASSYTWSPTVGLSFNTGASVTTTPTVTSNYTISGTDVNGCKNSVNSTISIAHPAIITVNSDTICAGDSTILIANGANSYSWQPIIGLSNTNGSKVTASPLITTTYSVTGVDGCKSDTALATVLVHSSPAANLVSNDIGCQAIKAAIEGANGKAPYTFTYQINGVRQLLVRTKDSSNTVDLSQKNVALGAYTFSLTGVRDAYNCYSSIINEVTTINVHQNPSAVFSVEPEKTSMLEPVVFVRDASIGGSSWMWDFGDGLKSFSQNSENHMYSDTGQYTIRLVITTKVGCKDSTYHTVKVTLPFVIYAPNAFTPNGDGFNDTFTPKGEGILKYEMNIFDRWGQNIFNTTDLNIGWDGKASGGSEIAQMDTYVYVINIKAATNKHDYTIKGNFNLVR